MTAFIISLEMFQSGDVPEELKDYIASLGDKEPFIILDESSKIKTNEPCALKKRSKRSQAVQKLNTTGDRCILTGTFMSKSPVNAYDQMNFLKKDFFQENIFQFAERYTIRQNLPNIRGARTLMNERSYGYLRRLITTKKDFSGYVQTMGITQDGVQYITDHADYTPFKHVDELWNRIGDAVMSVRREELFDMPPKTYRTFYVELTSEQKKLYKSLQNKHCTERIIVENPLTLYLRFQDVCNGYEPVDNGSEDYSDVELEPLKENPKLDALKEIAEEIGTAQCVIWCSRTRLLNDADAMLRDMGYTTGIYDGKVSKESRKKDYDRFVNKEIQFILINQASGAYGLDGLKDADYAVYLCNSYSVEQRQQSEDRIYRGYVTRNKYIIDISIRGTVEDRVTNALKRGEELINSQNRSADIFCYNEK